jgi:hypothetical protein
VFFGLLFPKIGLEAAPPAEEALVQAASKVGPRALRSRGRAWRLELEGAPRLAFKRAQLPLPRGRAGEFKSAVEHLEGLNSVFKSARPRYLNFSKSYHSVRSWFEGKLVPGVQRVHFEFPATAQSAFGRYRSFEDRQRAESAFEEICEALKVIDFAGLQNSGLAMNRDRARDGLSRFVELYIERASALLEARNVPHRVESTGQGGASELRLVVLPSKNHSPLNRFAWSLDKKKFTTLVDPGAMIFEGVGGWMSGGAREIAITHRDLLRGTLSRAEVRARMADIHDTSLTARTLRESAGEPLGSISLHELRHFSKERQRSQGQVGFLHGEVNSEGSNLPGFKTDSGYASYLGLDEIEAFFFQARVDARRLRRVLEMESMGARDEAASAILEMIDLSSAQALNLSERSAALAELALEQLAGGGRAYRTLGQAGYAVRLDVPGNPVRGWADWSIQFDLPGTPARTMDSTAWMKAQLEALKGFAEARVQGLRELQNALAETKGWKPGPGKIARARNLDVFLSPSAHESVRDGSVALRVKWEDALLREMRR